MGEMPVTASPLKQVYSLCGALPGGTTPSPTPISQTRKARARRNKATEPSLSSAASCENIWCQFSELPGQTVMDMTGNWRVERESGKKKKQRLLPSFAATVQGWPARLPSEISIVFTYR